MTVESEISSTSYVGDGTTGPYTVPFYFIKDEDLLVFKELIATGALTPFALTADYTLTGAGDSAGGEVTLTVALAATYRLYIKLDPPVTQSTHYEPNDNFPAPSHEKALDKLTQIVQRLVDKMKRAIKAPESETGDLLLGDTDYFNRANRVLGFDAGKNLKLLTPAELALVIGGAPGSQWYTQTFSGDGVTNNPVFALTSAPSSLESLDVSIDGVVQRPTADYTLAGANLTFVGIVDAGVNNVLVRWTSSILNTFIPADNSVTTPKLVDGVLSADVAGLAKMAAGYLQATVNGLAKMADGYFQVGGITKFVDGFFTDTAGTLAKFADGLWTFAKMDAGAIASQAEAEAGTSAVKLMTPQRTAQAIAVLASSVNSGVMQVIGNDCKNNAGTPNTQMDLDADAIVLRKADNAIKIKYDPGAALTCNIATAGPAANGRDQAGAFVAGWVYFYWIYNPTTDVLATIASSVAPPTGPTLPAGYTYWGFATSDYYTGAVLRKIRTKGSRVYYEVQQVVLAAGAAAGSAGNVVNVAAFVPPAALVMSLHMQGYSAAGYDTTMAVGAIAGSIVHEISAGTPAATGYHALSGDLPNIGQQFYYGWGAVPGGQGANIWVTGYKIPNGGE